ncbi:hypothetical protein, partial [Sphingomonas hylomeconis]|uniref:hypothetical protein n=1 Tax=Sphingomonas hylomeconis TaxID=1395958 RepID=UPI0021BB0973
NSPDAATTVNFGFPPPVGVQDVLGRSKCPKADQQLTGRKADGQKTPISRSSDFLVCSVREFRGDG